MWELFHLAVEAANLPYTILLGLVVLYWVLYLLGACGEDALDSLGLDLDGDVDVDADVDFDVDADVDADVDTDMHAGAAHGSALGAFLHFFHVGDVPIIMIFSTLALAMWFISIVTTHLLGKASIVIGLMLFVPIAIAGLMVTKAVIMPLAPWLRGVLRQEGDKVKILGRRCIVTSLEATSKSGQADIHTEEAPISLNVRTREGVILKKGDEAVVFDRDKEKNVYLIAALNVSTPRQGGSQSDASASGREKDREEVNDIEG